MIDKIGAPGLGAEDLAKALTVANSGAGSGGKSPFYILAVAIVQLCQQHLGYKITQAATKALTKNVEQFLINTASRHVVGTVVGTAGGIVLANGINTRSKAITRFLSWSFVQAWLSWI